MAEIEVETVGIVKRYGKLAANAGIDLVVERGEIHAIMGENGAGKSTLMSILYGLVQPDAGRVLLRGREVRFRSPVEAIRSGMGMVHQAFKLFNSLTVWENIVFGSEPRRGWVINVKAARARVRALAEQYHLKVDPDSVVGDMSVGVRQRVEILKALHRNASILILDEPTAVLTPRERDALFTVMRTLAEDGRTLLFVTHKLHEVMAIANRVTVLRDGRVTDRMVTAATSAREIIRAMIGRNVAPRVERKAMTPGRSLLEVAGLTIESSGDKPIVDNATLEARAGEIVGIAGVAGNGQTELIEAIIGLRRADRGRIAVNGHEVTASKVQQRRRAGVAYIPEDRLVTGSAPSAPASDNLVMGFHREPPFARWGRFMHQEAQRRARDLIGQFGIRITSERARVGTLSGGNLQKVVVARELTHAAPVLIAEQPSRGLDVGAAEFIHQKLMSERDRGCAVLLVSAEMSEILSLSDRILVMYEGRIIADLLASEANEERLGALLAGQIEAVT
jgi:ABC-type uncharacterized transport system ATPase subunit